MMMALIDFEVLPTDRERILERVQPLLEEARRMEGNCAYRASTDSENPAHIGLMHEWETLSHFRAYASSGLFERIGAILRPAMTRPPVSRRLQTHIIEEIRA